MKTSQFAAELAARHGLTDLSEIGRGGMGVVYRAWDAQLQRYVAVKRLSQEVFHDPNALQRFRGEMVMLGKIRHSSVVQIHLANIAGGPGSADSEAGVEAYFVMDYVHGATLSDLIRVRRETNTPFSLHETTTLLGPIASALDHIHLRMNPPIIHRDIKPANILVPHDPSSEPRSLLTDFGISLTPDGTRLTSLHSMIGTEKYLAPELLPGQANGPTGIAHSTPTPATDNYALALIAFRMLTLRHLQETMTAAQWQTNRPFPDLRRMSLPDPFLQDLLRVEPVLRKSLAAAPAYRHPTAGEFLRDLIQAGAQGAAAGAPPTSTSRSETLRQGNGHGNASAPAAVSTPTPLPTSAASTRTAPPPRHSPAVYRRRRWSVVGILALLVLVLGLLPQALSSDGTPDWDAQEAELVAAFPDLIADQQNTPAWNDLTCQAADAPPGTVAAVDCTGRDLELRALQYPTVEERDRAHEIIRATGEVEYLASSTCQATSIRDPRTEEYYLLPLSTGQNFALRLSGASAEALRLAIPVC